MAAARPEAAARRRRTRPPTWRPEPSGRRAMHRQQRQRTSWRGGVGRSCGVAKDRRLLWKGWWVLLMAVAFLGTPAAAKPDGDLCRWMNGRKYYVALGDTGSITATNVTTDGGGANSNGDHDPNQPRIPQRCSVELITCPSCHIVVSLLYINIPSCSSDGSCQCDYVWVKEPTVGKSGQEFCGIRSNQTVQKYESKTKLLSIDFLYSFSYADAFSIQFTSLENKYKLEGQVDYQHKGGASGFVESPHFPVGYPSDYSSEHTMQNLDERGFVQLVFTDFQLSPWSYVEVLDNGSRVDVYNGNTFRPPIVASAGPTLVVRFRANDEYPDLGFRAKYTFVNYPEKYWFNKPSTDCGGVVEDLGGAITMMNMANPGYTRNFDCIWLLRPSTSYTYETHISVRVAQFEEMGPESSLEIRQGLTSVSFLLESLAGHQSHKTPQGQEYIISANVGFYIRLQGSFSNKSRLAIVYSIFSYETLQCQSSGDFECGNGRCIKSILHCDGFNHCGDGSDESACFAVPGSGGHLPPRDSNWWRSLTPNYYFPKQESSAAAGTNTLILITSLAGLGMFVLTTVMILVKLHKQRRLEVVGRDALRTISADVDSDAGSVGQGRHPFGLNGTPLYDPPPSYEDVIKFYMPPPPAYSAIVEARSAVPVSSNPNPSHHSASASAPSHRLGRGIENAAYVPDELQCPSRQGSGASSDRRRSSSSSKATHLLRVILPPVTVFERAPQRRHKSTSVDPKQLGLRCEPSSRGQPSRHRHGAVPAVHSSNSSGGSSSSSGSSSGSSSLLASSGLVHTLLDRRAPTTSAEPNCSLSSPARDQASPKSLSQARCQCAGACSCATPSRTKVRRMLHTAAKYQHLNDGSGNIPASGLESSERSPEKVTARKVPAKSCSDALMPEPSTKAWVEPLLESIKPAQSRGPRHPTFTSSASENPSTDLQATEMTVTKDTQPLLRRTSSLPELAAVLPARLRVMPHEAIPAPGPNSAAPCDQVDSPKMIMESTQQ
ncbi:CUB and LDLa domain isoform X2 [Amblyomma americanum]